jgi:predicted sugar kinase
MKSIQTNAIITGIRARVDGSLGITLSTPELNPEEKVVFMELQNINCQTLFKPLEEKTDLIEVKGETETKTSSQRLRGCIYVLKFTQGKKMDQMIGYARLN